MDRSLFTKLVAFERSREEGLSAPQLIVESATQVLQALDIYLDNFSSSTTFRESVRAWRRHWFAYIEKVAPEFGEPIVGPIDPCLGLYRPPFEPPLLSSSCPFTAQPSRAEVNLPTAKPRAEDAEGFGVAAEPSPGPGPLRGAVHSAGIQYGQGEATAAPPTSPTNTRKRERLTSPRDCRKASSSASIPAAFGSPSGLASATQPAPSGPGLASAAQPSSPPSHRRRLRCNVFGADETTGEGCTACVPPSPSPAGTASQSGPDPRRGWDTIQPGTSARQLPHSRTGEGEEKAAGMDSKRADTFGLADFRAP
jgi:hypothetical protein